MYTEYFCDIYTHVYYLYVFSGIRNNLYLFFFPYAPVMKLRNLFPSTDYYFHGSAPKIVTNITPNRHKNCLFCAPLTRTTSFITYFKHCACMTQAEMQKAPTKCQPVHFPISGLQCLLRVVKQTARYGNCDSVIFKNFKIPRRKKRGIMQTHIYSFLGSFFVGTCCVVCLNMAGNGDINMPSIEILWCYSCSSVCFQHCVLSHD